MKALFLIVILFISSIVSAQDWNTDLSPDRKIYTLSKI